MNACPSPDALLDGGDAIDAHIDACAVCRAALSFAVKGRAGVGTMGRYELGTVIGAGGMGVVYRAWDPQLGRAVAVKVVSGAGRERERLLREARNLARVVDRNVCGVFDAGVEGEDVWIAMELVHGVTMRAWAADERSRRDLVRVLIEAGKGIAAAHEAGVVHRDVKPENVLVARDGRVVVTDFGLARVEIGAATTLEMSDEGGAEMGTRSGVIAGTPAYMAPEQLTGAEVDARADQFAWAVMAWELLRGARPFPAAAAERIAAVRVGVVARDRVERVLARAMRDAKRERWATVREMIDAFERAARKKRRLWMWAGVPVVVAAAAVALVVAESGQATTTSPLTSPSTSTVKPSTPPSPSPSPSPVMPVAPVKVSAPKMVVKRRPVDVLFGKVDRGRAEAVIADECPVTVDARSGADWGRVVRWEEIEVGVGGRTMKKLMYEVKGVRRSYVFDGRAHDQTLGSLDAAVGEWVVLCPGEDVDIYVMPAGWGAVNATEAYLPVAKEPRIPADEVRTLKGASGRVLVRVAPKARVDGGWEMGGWVVGDGVKGADKIREDHEIWAVVDVAGGVITPVEIRGSIF